MSWTTRLYIYTFCILFTASSYTMIVPFLPLYLLELGANSDNVTLWSSIIFAISFFIGGTMAPVWGKLSDIHGKKSMAIRSSVMLTLAYSTGSIVTSPLQLFFMRVLQGFANGYLPTVLSIVSSMSPPDKLGKSLSYIQSANLIGTVGGPLIGGILASITSLRMTFVIAGCFLLLVSIITIVMPDDKQEIKDSIHNSSIFEDIGYAFKTKEISELLIITFIFSVVMLAIQSILPLFINSLQGHEGKVVIYSGIICSLPSCVGAFTSPVWGQMGQRKGFFMTLCLSSVGAGVFLFLQGMIDEISSMMILACCMGIFICGIIPSVNASLSIVTKPDFRGRGFGILTMAGQYGCMLGPLLAYVTSYLKDLNTMFFISGLTLIAIGFYALIRHRQTYINRRI